MRTQFFHSLLLAVLCLLVLSTSVSAQQIVNGPRYAGMRPAGCVRVPMGLVTVRDCIYPGDVVVMWTDQDAGAVMLAVIVGDDWNWTQDGLDFFNLD